MSERVWWYTTVTLEYRIAVEAKSGAEAKKIALSTIKDTNVTPDYEQVQAERVTRHVE